MRFHIAHAVPALCAATAALLFTASQSQAAAPHPKPPAKAPARCAQQALTLRAKAVAGNPFAVRLSVTNRGTGSCVVDRFPTVTFGDLDGVALPVPASRGTGTYRLEAGKTAYAALRTIADPADPEARRVQGIAVSASAYQWGRAFTAARLGTGADVRVWEPVTTWWQRSAAAADRVLGLS